MIDYSEGSGLQYHIGVNADLVGKYVILPGDPGRVPKIARHLEGAKLVGENREYRTYTGTLEGEKVSVMSTGIGGPSASIGMEELIKCGCHTFIRMGTCGGMQLDVMSGDLIIANGAVRMEGTTREYAPMEYPAIADYRIVNKLAAAAEKLDLPYHVGVVQCKDAFYGQHEPEKMPVAYDLQNKWDAWIACGALASEMESAALFIVGSIRRVRVGSILLTVANQERAKRRLPNPQVHEVEAATRVTIEALRQLIREDGEQKA